MEIEYNTQTNEATIISTVTETVNIEQLRNNIATMTVNIERQTAIRDSLQAKLDAILPVQEEAVNNLNVETSE